jgi:hypothetical protein
MGEAEDLGMHGADFGRLTGTDAVNRSGRCCTRPFALIRRRFSPRRKQRGDGAGLPGFVISEFEWYLACGILAHGFARVRCSSCGNEMLIALHRRTWTGRRTAHDHGLEPVAPGRRMRSGAQARESQDRN